MDNSLVHTLVFFLALSRSSVLILVVMDNSLVRFRRNVDTTTGVMS